MSDQTLKILKDAAEIARISAPFLRDLIERDHDRFTRIVEADPNIVFANALDQVASADVASEAEVMQVLREAKTEVALLLALCDIAKIWDTQKVTQSLSQFAKVALQKAVDFVLKSAADKGILTLTDEANPSVNSGLIVLGMGKFGAEELNYSSDIDIIVFYDPERVQMAEPLEIKKHFVRMTKQIAKIMQDRTEHGYVFRTDLRLRPDPGSTTVAISVEAALNYYEVMGQNWERAAFIKARPVAGDLEAGEVFLKELAPFVWRKYMDFATIADVQSMKRQIHRYKGHGEIAVLGHDVKLGRGGIREIEFFVQTQQLIAGGRNTELRGLQTLQMLQTFVDAKWIKQSVADELSVHYCFLRDVEHRIQMRFDEQTHKLPDSEEGLADIARLMGIHDAEDFTEQLKSTFSSVAGHYSSLFEDAGGLDVEEGSLVFTGDEDDPETLETITQLGFQQPAQVSAVVRGWHYGRYAAMRSEKARALLTELVPLMLKIFGQSSNPDSALFAFDRFLERLPAGVQLFALLRTNRDLIGLLADVMGSAPRLSDVIARRPHVFDTLIDPSFFDIVPTKELQADLLSRFLGEAKGYEDKLDRMRIFGQEQVFLTGIRLLTGAAEPKVVGELYSDLADVLVSEALDAAKVDMEKDHGIVPDMQVAVLALGKHGGRELTATSDLDLFLIYDFDSEQPQSNGDKSLSAQKYFTRLTQRFVSALSAPTAEGVLYELDLRLRPSGSKGPLAVRLEAFERYQQNDAWTWEHMALTRARTVCGEAELQTQITAIISKTIGEAVRDELQKDVADMNAKLHAAKPANSIWQLKERHGGLIDIEFLVQYFALKTGGKIDAHNTAQALIALQSEGLLSAAEGQALSEANETYNTLIHLLRLCLTGGFEPQTASEELKRRLASAVNQPDFAHLEAQLQDFQQRVRALATQKLGMSDEVHNSQNGTSEDLTSGRRYQKETTQ